MFRGRTMSLRPSFAPRHLRLALSSEQQLERAEVELGDVDNRRDRRTAAALPEQQRCGRIYLWIVVGLRPRRSVHAVRRMISLMPTAKAIAKATTATPTTQTSVTASLRGCFMHFTSPIGYCRLKLLYHIVYSNAIIHEFLVYSRLRLRLTVTFSVHVLHYPMIC